MAMKIWVGVVLVTVACGAGGLFVWNSTRFATREEAVQMVKDAVIDIKTDQKGTFSAITAKAPKWRYKDLYPVVYSTKGEVYAHGQNEKQVGLNLLALRDPNGKFFIKERVDLAAAKEPFWQQYKFTDPITREALDKEAYCERTGVDLIVCAGIYKR